MDAPLDDRMHLRPSKPGLVSIGETDFARLARESAGRPFVFDDGDFRTLHFEVKYVQSEMRLSAPNELVLSYTRAMMGFLLFKNAPREILMIGLGGGSLAKFCYQHLSTTRITVVEISADVIALRDKFMIPADDERLQIVHADAVDFIAQSSQKYDVIMLDGFTSDGQPAALSSASFYAACRKRLARRGVLVANLTGYDPNFTLSMTRLHLEFGRQMWWGQAIGSCNGIVFAVKNKRELTYQPPLTKRALRIDQRFNLDLLPFVSRLQTTAANGEADSEQLIDDDDELSLASLEKLAEAVKKLLFIADAKEHGELHEALAKLELGDLSSAVDLMENVVAILGHFSNASNVNAVKRMPHAVLDR